jgi:hypothetical protein
MYIIIVDNTCFDIRYLFKWIFIQKRTHNPVTNEDFKREEIVYIFDTAMEEFKVRVILDNRKKRACLLYSNFMFFCGIFQLDANVNMDVLVSNLSQVQYVVDGITDLILLANPNQQIINWYKDDGPIVVTKKTRTKEQKILLHGFCRYFKISTVRLVQKWILQVVLTIDINNGTRKPVELYNNNFFTSFMYFLHTNKIIPKKYVMYVNERIFLESNVITENDFFNLEVSDSIHLSVQRKIGTLLILFADVSSGKNITINYNEENEKNWPSFLDKYTEEMVAKVLASGGEEIYLGFLDKDYIFDAIINYARNTGKVVFEVFIIKPT